MADAQMKIRLPNAIKLRLEAAAGSNGRSLNSEVVLRLEQSFAADDDRDAQLDALKQELLLEIKELRDELRHQGSRIVAIEHNASEVITLE